MAALVFVLILCVSGLTAVSMQVRCIDAAREAARLAARGDGGSASNAAQRTAPDGAAGQLRREGDFVVATVTACVSSSDLAPAVGTDFGPTLVSWLVCVGWWFCWCVGGRTGCRFR
jgi:hypothetical protein